MTQYFFAFDVGAQLSCWHSSRKPNFMAQHKAQLSAVLFPGSNSNHHPFDITMKFDLFCCAAVVCYSLSSEVRRHLCFRFGFVLSKSFKRLFERLTAAFIRGVSARRSIPNQCFLCWDRTSAAAREVMPWKRNIGSEWYLPSPDARCLEFREWARIQGKWVLQY